MDQTIFVSYFLISLLLWFLSPRSRVFINSTCDQIKIIPVNDYDSHYLISRLDENLNVSVLEHSLPENERYFKQVGTIAKQSETFFWLLDQMENFYKQQINTIDELTYVVDPQSSSHKAR